MKSRLLAILLLIILIAGALVYGAEKGWAQERALVENHLSTLQQQLDTRVETACNILTVAHRHMDQSDPLLLSLAASRDTLAGNAPLSEKASANTALSQDAQSILEKLSALNSVQNDSRDQMYVESMLPQMLKESENYTAQSAYNTAAEDFNKRFEQNIVSSFIARWFGIDRCEVFSAQP